MKILDGAAFVYLKIESFLLNFSENGSKITEDNKQKSIRIAKAHGNLVDFHYRDLSKETTCNFNGKSAKLFRRCAEERKGYSKGCELHFLILSTRLALFPGLARGN